MTQARDLADIIAGANTLPSAAMPSGSVLQVVQATSGTGMQSSTENTWHDLQPTVTITPQSTSNKVLITHTAGIMCFESTLTVMYRILRDTTEIVQIGRVYSYVATSYWTGHMLALEYLDSPSTTSATTYKIQLQFSGSAGQVRHNNLTGSFSPKAITIAKEIAG
jgi:hypothetical protein